MLLVLACILGIRDAQSPRSARLWSALHRAHRDAGACSLGRGGEMEQRGPGGEQGHLFVDVDGAAAPWGTPGRVWPPTALLTSTPAVAALPRGAGEATRSPHRIRKGTDSDCGEGSEATPPHGLPRGHYSFAGPRAAGGVACSSCLPGTVSLVQLERPSRSDLPSEDQGTVPPCHLAGHTGSRCCLD